MVDKLISASLIELNDSFLSGKVLTAVSFYAGGEEGGNVAIYALSPDTGETIVGALAFYDPSQEKPVEVFSGSQLLPPEGTDKDLVFGGDAGSFFLLRKVNPGEGVTFPTLSLENDRVETNREYFWPEAEFSSETGNYGPVNWSVFLEQRGFSLTVLPGTEIPNDLYSPTYKDFSLSVRNSFLVAKQWQRERQVGGLEPLAPKIQVGPDTSGRIVAVFITPTAMSTETPVPTETVTPEPTATPEPTETSLPTATSTPESRITPTKEVVQEIERVIEITSSREYSGEFSGIPVPFVLAIAPSAYEGNYGWTDSKPIVDFHLNNKDFPEMNIENFVAEHMLRVYHLAWIEDSPGERNDTSFEDYLELVKKGEGKFWIMGSDDDPNKHPDIKQRAEIVPLEFDPSKDTFVYVLSNRYNGLPVKYTDFIGSCISETPGGRFNVERTFPSANENRSPDSFNFATASFFFRALRVLTYPNNILDGEHRGTIGGLIPANFNLNGIESSWDKPQQEKRKGIFRAVRG